MATFADYDDRKFELPAEGKFAAILTKFIDLGLQESRFGISRQADLTFEICGQTTSEGQPVLAFKRVWNVSTRSKNFRNVVRALSGAHEIARVGPRDIIGKSCNAVIEHSTDDDGVAHANIECSPGNGKSAPKPVSQLVFFSLHPEDFDKDVLASLSDRQREKIMASRTYKELINPPKVTRAADIIDDDFPESLGGAPEKKPE